MVDSSLLSGVLSIDQEHQLLFRMLDELADVQRVDPTIERFQAIVTRLGKQIRQHFENEEGILRTCGMPTDDVTIHIQGHSHILDQYAQLEANLMSGKGVERSAMPRLINGWLKTHHIDFDTKIKQYLTDIDGVDELVLERVCRNRTRNGATT